MQRAHSHCLLFLCPLSQCKSAVRSQHLYAQWDGGEACGAKTRQSAETLPFSPCALFQPLCRVAAPLMIWDKFCPMEQSARTGCGCDKRRAPIVFFICAAPNKAANTCTLFSIRGVSLEDSLKMESLSLFGNLVLFSSAFHRTTFAVVPQEKNYKRHF